MFWYHALLFAWAGYFVGFIHGLIAEERTYEGHAVHVPVPFDRGEDRP